MTIWTIVILASTTMEIEPDAETVESSNVVGLVGWIGGESGPGGGVTL